jgi:hypothetical protein
VWVGSMCTGSEGGTLSQPPAGAVTKKNEVQRRK